MDGSLEPRPLCPEAVAAGGKASAKPRLSARPSLLLLSGALVESDAKSSELFRDPSGSLQAWFTILVMPLASLLEMSSGRLPGDSTLTPRRRAGWVAREAGGWGDVLPDFGEDCACRLDCMQSVESKGWERSLVAEDEGEAGNGEGGLICTDVPSWVPSALLVSASLVPRVQGQRGEGECGSWCWAPTSMVWWPPSCWMDISKLRGSESSPNDAPGCAGTTSPTGSSSILSPTASTDGSTGSKGDSLAPLVQSGGSWG